MSARARLRRLIPSREKLLASRWLRWLAPRLDHPNLWRWSRRGVALGVAVGVFFGLLIPLAQIPLSAAAAILLRANLPAAAASTLISNPATYGPIYFAAYKLGAWITGASTLPAADRSASAEEQADRTLAQRIASLGKPLLVGLLVMAACAGLISYFLIDLVWRWPTARRWRGRKPAGRGPQPPSVPGDVAARRSDQ